MVTLIFGIFCCRKTNNPHMHRASKLLVYLWTTIHWIACFYYMLSEVIEVYFIFKILEKKFSVKIMSMYF